MDLNDLEPYVQDATHRVMRKFYRFTEREDVEQECRIWLIRHPQKVAEYLADDRTHSLVKSMENAGLKFAHQEKAIKSGYRYDDVFFWSEGDIETLLPALFSDDARVNPPTSDDEGGGRSNRPPSEGGNWIATLADLSRVFAQLDERSKWVLLRVFGLDETRTKVAYALNVSDTTVGKIIERAVRKMHRELGGSRPASHHDCGECVGTRKVMSNAQSNAILKGQYDHE